METIEPGDSRYRSIVEKRFNKRYLGHPDFVVQAHSTHNICEALERAVREGRRLAVTSGGHCLENFVSNGDVKVVLDVSAMKTIELDAARTAVSVQCGATVGETFRALHERWGQVIPLGEYPHIGIGGHVLGGAFGFLCRQLGLAVDYLSAVEVVTLDANGKAVVLEGSRDPDDPHHELWWAHTGGGGGNFGIVTRYFFRSNDAGAALLPRSPERVTTFELALPWNDVDRSSFTQLVHRFGAWVELHSTPGTKGTGLIPFLQAPCRSPDSKIMLRGVATDADQIALFLRALELHASKPQVTEHAWLDFALNPFPSLFDGGPPQGVRSKVKDALLKRNLTIDQCGIIFDFLTRPDAVALGGAFGLLGYGGKVNAVQPDATASAQRSSILDLACNVGWVNEADEDSHLQWVRAFAKALFADAGGVPALGDAYEGTLINHPDLDLADPRINDSGVPWHTLYYPLQYERLQRAKRRYDPLNQFRHGLSIQP